MGHISSKSLYEWRTDVPTQYEFVLKLKKQVCEGSRTIVSYFLSQIICKERELKISLSFVTSTGIDHRSLSHCTANAHKIIDEERISIMRPVEYGHRTRLIL